MRKLISLFIIIFILFIIAPGKFTQHTWDIDDEFGFRGYKISPPIGGCFASCGGFVVKQTCSRSSPNSYEVCDNICIGLVTGTCGVNPISAKLGFINSLFFN